MTEISLDVYRCYYSIKIDLQVLGFVRKLFQKFLTLKLICSIKGHRAFNGLRLNSAGIVLKINRYQKI